MGLFIVSFFRTFIFSELLFSVSGLVKCYGTEHTSSEEHLPYVGYF